jgi:hypothetical protein
MAAIASLIIIAPLLRIQRTQRNIGMPAGQGVVAAKPSPPTGMISLAMSLVEPVL